MNFYIIEEHYHDEDYNPEESTTIYKTGFTNLDKAKEFAENIMRTAYEQMGDDDEEDNQPDLFEDPEDKTLKIIWEEVDPIENFIEDGVDVYKPNPLHKHWISESIYDTTFTDYYIHLITID